MSSSSSSAGGVRVEGADSSADRGTLDNPNAPLSAAAKESATDTYRAENDVPRRRNATATDYSSTSHLTRTGSPVDQNRPGLPRSQSNRSNIAASPSSASSSQGNPYAGLQYAPRQRNTNSFRASLGDSQLLASLKQEHREQPAAQEMTSLKVMSSPTASTSLSNMASASSSSTRAGEPSIEVAGMDLKQLETAEAHAKQQLRADVNLLGLPEDSIGWAILEKIQAATAGEWRELGEMLGRGEATLLLPTSQSRGGVLSLSHAYNHVIFSTSATSSANLFTSTLKGKERQVSDIVTLKGLRATLLQHQQQQQAPPQSATLCFQSFVPREDMRFVSQMRTRSGREDLFSTLIPLPMVQHVVEGKVMPIVTIFGHTDSLLLPPSFIRYDEQQSRQPRTSAALLSPTEQRPGNRASASFATLFGGRGSDRRTVTSVEDNLPQQGDAASTGVIQVAQPTRTIAVAIVDREIRRSQVLWEIGSSMKERMRLSLMQDSDETNLPADIVDVVCSFAEIFVPPPNRTAAWKSPSRHSSTDTDASKISASGMMMHAPFLLSPDALADSFQEFYSDIRNQLGKAAVNLDEMRELQGIETLLCTEIYDRIFCPYTSTDASHDEALDSRIASLDKLGVTLRHLGIAVPETPNESDERVRLGLDQITTDCGILLKSIGDTSCTSPAEKLQTLVAAHKVIVEGLAKLPKIELVDDVQAKGETEPTPSAAVDPAKEESPTANAANPATSSADLILPILIYCIIKSNPPRLASNLLYIQRFHAEALVQGEASYCLVNVQAAVAFLENVETASLGLESDIPLVTAREVEAEKRRRSDEEYLSVADGGTSLSMPMRMKSRVAHDIGELAGMSNRAITEVLGSSMGAFGRMMGAGTNMAMGVGPGQAAGVRLGDDQQSGKRSIEDIRDVLTSSAAAVKLGSVLNKVVAMEKEGKEIAPRQAPAFLRTKTSSRSNLRAANAATDYGKGSSHTEIASTSSAQQPISDGKRNINDRLASLPLLSRQQIPSSTSPQRPTFQRDVSDAASSTVSASPTRSLYTSHKAAEHLRLQASTALSPRPRLGPPSPVSPGLHLDPGLLVSPAPTMLELEPAFEPEQVAASLPSSLQSPYEALSRPPNGQRPLHIVLASTGSVASIKMPLIIEALLRHDNVRLQIISTKASRRFYNTKAVQEKYTEGDEPYTLQTLAQENAEAGDQATRQSKTKAVSRLHIWTDEDEWEQWNDVGDPILHIELRRWADVVVIAPCSANTLAKINAGICDDLLTSFLRALSPTTPTYLCPAMNTLMYMHPLTSRHLDFAQNVLGYKVLGPIEKRLACGDLGQGAMLEWSNIVDLLAERYALVQSSM